jgi:hypothetical protein
MNAGNSSEHEQDILDNPLVRGFLQEGAAAIARKVQIAELPAEMKRFYLPGMPTTEEEYETKVRDPVKLFFDEALAANDYHIMEKRVGQTASAASISSNEPTRTPEGG